MATKAAKQTETAASFTKEQIKHIRDIVDDYLTNDEFDISLSQQSVVDACRTVLEDKSVLTKLAEVVKQ